MEYKNCKVCNKQFYKPYNCSRKNWNVTKFCSRKCFHEQHKVWLGRKRSDLSKIMKDQYKEGKRKPIIMRDGNNPAWKGEEASYSAFHHWLYNRLERTYWCYLGDHEITKKSEFANIAESHDHKLEYYIESCTSCHRLFDNNKPLIYS
jgi:hypothetical protein